MTMTDRVKTTSRYGLLGFFLLVGASVGYAQDAALQELAAELTQDSNNPILQMQQQMLSHKNEAESVPTTNWRWAQRRTNLRRELTGPVVPRGRSGSFSRSAALLTGQRAIDESLQLGSIGVNRNVGEQSDWVPIEEIESVGIPSHPWAEMVAGQTVTIPEISRLVPDDVLFVNMIQPDKFLEFEGIVQRQSDLFGDVYGLGDIMRMKSKMMQRLGIPDADALIALVDEMAFVSDDLSFMPRTDYAVILKLTNELAEKGLGFIVGDKAIHRKVGDYMVIATHESLISRIEHAHENPDVAMYAALDYHYALLQMEPQRDGLIYLSEAFIRKLTGPVYRINARRRNTILDALETLQYSVFAYRRLTDHWPASIQEIVDANYIAADPIYAPDNYSIGKDGRVSHRAWGTLWKVTPVSQVPVDRVTVMEKANYQSFSAGYQSFFREFFDPISVAYTISDQLYLHTLILPLINNSNYRDLRSFFGGTRDPLSFLFDADRLGAVNIAAQFSVDDLLVRAAGSRRRPGDDNETADARRTRLIHQAENRLSEEIFDKSLQPGERLLDFIGDEIFFGVGEKNSLSVSNIADIDIWLGLKLNDRERAEQFFRQLWQKLASRMGRGGGGMLQLSGTEPLSNEYNGQKFFLLPTGFVNVYYVFYDDAFYVTISQVAMNRLIDARNDDDVATFSEHLERSFAHIGATHNIVAALDLEKMASFELGRELSFWGQRVSTQFIAHRDTLQEAMTLAKMLPEFDGTLQNVESYYRDLPTAFYGAQFEADAGSLYLTINEQRNGLGDIAVDRRGGVVNELLKSSLSADDLRDRVREFRALTLGLSFVPEGLEVKLSVGNPNVTEADARFASSEPGSGGGATTGLTLLCLLIVALRRSTSMRSLLVRQVESNDNRVMI